MDKNVDAVTLKPWVDAGDVLLIDVREQEEYDAAHVEGAVLLPLSSFTPESVPAAGEKKLVFMCKVGGRSARARALWGAYCSDQESWNFDGGIDSWIAHGFEVVSA